MFLTVLILVAQEQYMLQNDGSLDESDGIKDQTGGRQRRLVRPTDDSYIGRGVQVIVGHFNGKLPDEYKSNLTDGS